MRGDRGGQTLCLIERLSRMAGSQSPAVSGLSATIGDPEGTRQIFLSAGHGAGNHHPENRRQGQGKVAAEPWSISTSTTRRPRRIPSRRPGGAARAGYEETDDAPANADPGIAYVFEHTRGKKVPGFRQFPRRMRNGHHHAAPLLRARATNPTAFSSTTATFPPPTARPPERIMKDDSSSA